ncbi:MAG TPA: mycofactocin biosynthesis glycosyltransferase MftF [Mycobacteriales bacterium]|nr:mycofactocin biosynthesis glycosyltransferase MftF [Mycobacteriales bacterium]
MTPAGRRDAPVVLDPRTRRLHGDRTLLSPTGRLLRLGPRGPQALEQLARGVGDDPARRLARTLLDADAAHPHPDPHPADDVTVVIPVKDRVTELEVCLAALRGHDVIVVDDGSLDAAAVDRTCRHHGARLERRPNGGPAAARNTALPLVHKDFVAFLDSDCLPPRDWLEALRGHFEDPSVVAVAPRVVGGPRSPLDLGPHPALVRPGTAVAYVPTAALLVRRSAVLPFEEGLRWGEDVDLVWRLVEAGGSVRYDPSVVVEHREPVRLGDRLVRRYRYGTSAAPLAQRHPGSLTHLVLHPWPTAVLALLLVRRPWPAAAVAAGMAGRVDRHVHHLPTSAARVGTSVNGTAAGLGRALAMLGPLAWWAATRDRRAAALLLWPVVQEWRERRPDEDLPEFTARVLLDQAAYGAGVVAGCVEHRTASPLVPRAGRRRRR